MLQKQGYYENWKQENYDDIAAWYLRIVSQRQGASRVGFLPTSRVGRAIGHPKLDNGLSRYLSVVAWLHQFFAAHRPCTHGLSCLC